MLFVCRQYKTRELPKGMSVLEGFERSVRDAMSIDADSDDELDIYGIPKKLAKELMRHGSPAPSPPRRASKEEPSPAKAKPKFMAHTTPKVKATKSRVRPQFE